MNVLEEKVTYGVLVDLGLNLTKGELFELNELNDILDITNITLYHLIYNDLHALNEL